MAEQSNLLEPGKDIRPVIDHNAVKLLAERLYGISVLELTELDGYDDKNYKLIEDPNMKNPLITEHSPHGYVLKIMNSMDSQNRSIVEAQNEILNYLNVRSVVCPKPIRNVFGHLYSVENINGKQHAVRLLNWLPGEMFKNAPRSEALLYQLGEFVANLNNKLQNFNHSGLVNREHMWMLTKVPDLEKFKYVIKDAEKLDLAEEVIEEFKYAVVPRLDELEKGVIHGDINEMNVLVGVKPGGSEGKLREETSMSENRNIRGHVISAKLHWARVVDYGPYSLYYERRPESQQWERWDNVVVDDDFFSRQNETDKCKSDYRITGLLDFGDIQYSYYVFELAITMAYAMLLTGDPRSGGYVLAGYTVNRRLPDEEYRLLKTLISARLVQSLILGAYSLEQDPTNTYVSSTEKANGWEMLKKIRKTRPSAEHGDHTDWKGIANDYLTKS